jgi:hypothetical protein
MLMIRGHWLVVLTSSLVISTGIAQPKISIEGGTKIDMGTIDRGTPGEKKLTIKNMGTDTLILGAVEVSCGCTGTVVSSNHIAPGGTGELLITFNSVGYVGEVHKSVTVNSNDSSSARTVIGFTATVVEEVAVNPRQLFFRDAEVGKVDTFNLSITNAGKKPFSVTGYQCALAGLTLDIPKEPVKPSETVRIKGEFKPKEARSVLTDLVAIQTSSKKQPEINIFIYGAIREPNLK